MMASDREKLLMSTEKFKAHTAMEKGERIERKKELLAQKRVKQVELKFIQAEKRIAEREIQTQKEEQIKFRKRKIRKLKRGLGRKLGMSFQKIGQAIRKKRRVKILKVAIKRKKQVQQTGIFEKRREDESLFFRR